MAELTIVEGDLGRVEEVEEVDRDAICADVVEDTLIRH